MHWEHCTLYSKSKHEEKSRNYLITLQKMKKNEHWAVQKNSSVCILLYKHKYLPYKLKNIHDSAFLWITKLIFSCISTVSENRFTSVLRGVDQLLASVNRYSSPGWCHNSSAFLGFASQTAFLMSPNKFSIGDWAGHSMTLILLVWNQESARLLVCLGSSHCSRMIKDSLKLPVSTMMIRRRLCDANLSARNPPKVPLLK